jgi:hypothetical protein
MNLPIMEETLSSERNLQTENNLKEEAATLALRRGAMVASTASKTEDRGFDSRQGVKLQVFTR